MTLFFFDIQLQEYFQYRVLANYAMTGVRLLVIDDVLLLCRDL